MKTVNKILLTALGIILIALIAIFITLRIELSREVHKGSGQIVSQERVLNSFTEVESRGNLVIYLIQSDNHGVTVETDHNLIDFLETSVRGERLRIRLTEPVRSHSEIKLYVQIPDLIRIEGNAGSQFKTSETLHGDLLSIELGSGARGTLALDYEQLSVSLKSGAFSKLSGNVNAFFGEGSSGSILDARSLISATSEVASKSGAEVTVFVTESLTANASSGGVIKYHGNPAHKSWRSSSGGEIIAK